MSGKTVDYLEEMFGFSSIASPQSVSASPKSESKLNARNLHNIIRHLQTALDITEAVLEQEKQAALEYNEHVRPKHHKKIRVYCKPLSASISVDQGIAPILMAIWEIGIDTVGSCQEYMPGFMRIDFFGTASTEAFLNVLVDGIGSDYPRDELVAGIFGWGYKGYHWKYETNIVDGRAFRADCHRQKVDYSEPSNMIISSSVIFPIKDYQRISDLLTLRINKGSKGRGDR